MALVDFAVFLIPMALFGLIGVFSLFWYTRTRRTGFVWIGVGFLLEIFPNLIRLVFGGPYIPSRLVEQGLTFSEIQQFLFLLYLVDPVILVAFAVLVLVGLLSLAKSDQK